MSQACNFLYVRLIDTNPNTSIKNLVAFMSLVVLFASLTLSGPLFKRSTQALSWPK